MIKESGGNTNKFAKSIINTIAGDIKTFLPAAERTKFTTYSPQKKAKLIVDQANLIVNASGFDSTKTNFDINSVMDAVKSGDLSKIKILNTDTKDNKVDTTSGFKSGSMKIIN